MSKRGLALVLVLTFAVAAGAFLEDFRLDRFIITERVSVDAVERAINAAQNSLTNFRAAQAAYIAADQGRDAWLKRATGASADVETSISNLQSATNSTDARVHYDAAISILGTMNGLDQKAREALANGERPLAADTVLVDSAESASGLSVELSSAERAEQAAADLRIGRLRLWRLELAAGSLALLFLAALMLGLRSPRTLIIEVPAPQLEVQEPAEDFRRPSPAPASVTAPSPTIDLSAAANLCVDLARVLDGRDVQPLFDRAATVLNAKGLVLWMADGDRATLKPSLTHGYSGRVLQRMGSLRVDADNVTSSVFRSMQAQTLSTAQSTTEAIAVPLMTTTGCIGVLSAEVGRLPSSSDTVAVAKMLAAQLATLFAPAGEPVPSRTAEA